MDWSIREGARVINMSFAGPRDPMMTRAIQVAASRRIAMVAAMGNEGPARRSPILPPTRTSSPSRPPTRRASSSRRPPAAAM